MIFTCTECEYSFDTRHPLHKISSKKGRCGNCYKEKEPEEGRYIMVTEGTGSSKGYISWHRKSGEGANGVSSSTINYHTNFTQRFQPIGRGKGHK